ncbi:MAG: hypothetical protein KIS83_03530 [Rubrivivax sp.]|nr:hypothetical protein [Rubrivivax sp.]
MSVGATEATALGDWLNAAWDRHADAPREVADELQRRAATLPDDADGAMAVRLAEHVLLAHLDDAPALQRLLAALPAGTALDAAAARARWGLAVLAGEGTPPVLPDAARWGALQNVVLALLQRGQVGAARECLLADEAAAAASEDAAARRAYAATANNVAVDLRLGPRGDAARDALMLDAAALARRAWERAGTWMHVERADYQLAMCHAVLGQGEPARAAARACLAACEREGADAAERFFAHECNVHAERAAGDAAAAAAHRERMVALLAQIEDPGLRTWCAETLAKT